MVVYVDVSSQPHELMDLSGLASALRDIHLPQELVKPLGTLERVDETNHLLEGGPVLLNHLFLCSRQ